MKKLVLCLVFAFAHVFTWAQSTEVAQKQKLAKEIIEVMGSLEEMKKITDRLTGVIRQQFLASLQRSSPQLTPQQLNRASVVFSKVIVEEVNTSMTEIIPTMMQGMETLYVNKFSMEELTELHRFTTGPTGRKHQAIVVNELPNLMAPAMAQMQNMAPRMLPRIQAAMKQLVDEGTLPKTP